MEYGSPTASEKLEQKKIKCYIVPDSIPGSRFSSRFSYGFSKLDKYCIIHGTETHSLLFDISTIKMQSFHHKITFLQFSTFSEKLQIYVNKAALDTIISNLNKPYIKPLDQNQCQNNFLFYISTIIMQSFHYKITSLYSSKNRTPLIATGIDPKFNTQIRIMSELRQYQSFPNQADTKWLDFYRRYSQRLCNPAE